MIINDWDYKIGSEIIYSIGEWAKKLRSDVIKMTNIANAGHPGGSLSCADIIASLYFCIMKIDPKNPLWPDRDRFILSKGHACPILYAALAEREYFPKEVLWTLRKIDSPLQGHPDMTKTIGIDMTTGSLGNGLGAGIGVAISAKIFNKNYMTYVVCGDGELDEGIIWESAMTASKYKLDNLLLYIDYNHLQLDGFIEDVMPLEPLVKKWQAFNWNVVEIDGHDIKQILTKTRKAIKSKNRSHTPTVIIAHTLKGKGVSFMENKCDWHGKAPNQEECDLALKELMLKEGDEVIV